MNFKEYVENALRTCPVQPLSIEADTQIILHSAVGLMGELVELEHAYTTDNFKEEVGDLWWYFAIGVDALARNGIAIPYALFPHSMDRSVLVHSRIHASTILDMAKRMVWYRAEFKTRLKTGSTVAIALEESYGQMMACLTKLTDEAGMTEQECWEMNVRKLKARYPQGFSGKKALNRDLEKEKSAMDGQ
jgi:hypothetical protein